MPCAEVEQKVRQLQNACAKELTNTHSVLNLMTTPEGYVTPSQRDQAVVYLLKLSEHFAFDAETFGYAVACLDRFLSRVKAQTRYLQCISLASLLVASKLSEEEENVPKVSDFVTVSRSTYTTADLQRMESVLLQKIEWEVYMPTPIFFLQKFAELLVALGYFPKQLLVPLLRQCTPVLIQLMCQSALMQHRGSVLALGVLNLKLGNVEGMASHWIEEMARFGMICDEEFIHCCGLINDYLDLQMVMYHEGPKRRKTKRRKRSTCSVTILPTIWEDNPNEQVDEEMSHPNNDVEMTDDQGEENIEDVDTGSYQKQEDFANCQASLILEDKAFRMLDIRISGSEDSNVTDHMTDGYRGNSVCSEEISQLQRGEAVSLKDSALTQVSENRIASDAVDEFGPCEPVHNQWNTSGKPLYSTVVKRSCSTTVCSSQPVFSRTVMQRQTLAY